jgi:hypothetical protein
MTFKGTVALDGFFTSPIYLWDKYQDFEHFFIYFPKLAEKRQFFMLLHS